MGEIRKDTDYTKYQGGYVGGQSYKHRKPIMGEDKRKVLDLLEVCIELAPSLRVCQIISNAVPRHGDHYYVEDKDLAQWLQDYADLLTENERAKHRKEKK